MTDEGMKMAVEHIRKGEINWGGDDDVCPWLALVAVAFVLSLLSWWIGIIVFFAPIILKITLKPCWLGSHRWEALPSQLEPDKGNPSDYCIRCGKVELHYYQGEACYA